LTFIYCPEIYIFPKTALSLRSDIYCFLIFDNLNNRNAPKKPLPRIFRRVPSLAQAISAAVGAQFLNF